MKQASFYRLPKTSCINLSNITLLNHHKWKMVDKIKENIDSNKWIIEWTKVSLSLLEKETRIWFFKKASDWIKTLLWFDWWNKSNLPEQRESHNKLKVKETRDYISNWWTFYSPSKWLCQWNKYRSVCSTGSFNVLRRLW